MHQFIYKAEHAGLSEWPSGILRLANIEVTTDSASADVFVIPGTLRIFEKSSGVLDLERLNRLPHFKGNEHRTVAFDISDNFVKPVNLPIIFLRCDVRSWMLPSDPNSIAIAWPVEDFEECVSVSPCGFKYDLSFQGWTWSCARRESVTSIGAHGGIAFDFAGYSDFFGYLKKDNPEFHRRRLEFRRSMKESRLALCPESIESVAPYRFYEAMSAGRVPVLVISDDVVLPFETEIPYSDFVCWITASSAHNAAQSIRNYLDAHSDRQLVEKGLQARYYWEKWLNREDWPRTMAYAVSKKIGMLCAS